MPTKWKEGEIVEKKWLSDTTIHFAVRTKGDMDFPFIPGQFITMDLPTGEKRLDRWRSYSVASDGLDEDGCFELCIVHLIGGKASTYLFDELEVGNLISFKGPEGQFILPGEEDFSKLVMVCTGTGVAPFRSMIQRIYKRSGEKRPVHLIFGCRYEKDLLYRAEFEELAKIEAQFEYTPVLSRDENWLGNKGYVHGIYESVYTVHDDVMFLLCGWTPMVEEARARLIKMGFDPTRIRSEIYG